MAGSQVSLPVTVSLVFSHRNTIFVDEVFLTLAVTACDVKAMMDHHPSVGFREQMGNGGFSHVSLLLSRGTLPLRNPRNRKGTWLVPAGAKLTGRLLACGEVVGESGAKLLRARPGSCRLSAHAVCSNSGQPWWVGGRSEALFVTAS